jgi:hypothetical protein
MLPDAEYLPALFSKSTCHQTIPDAVGFQLFEPKGRIVFGLDTMFWAPMPEATVYEYDQFDFGENKVRFA